MGIFCSTAAYEPAAFTLANQSDYPRFADIMDKFNYSGWEAYEVTTADGYILTTFHIPAQTATSKGHVLTQHGDMEDGASWVANYGDEKSFHLQLADQGYDIWIGNNRGTEYSQRHVEYQSTGDSAESYWDFTWAEMAYDDVANIEGIKSVTGEDKITYLGYSQGTIQMHYALAHDEDLWFQDNLKRVIQLAPCFVADVPNLVESEYDSTVATFRDNGIYAINGPNWEEDLAKICSLYDDLICYGYTQREGSQPVSVKAEQYWAQNGIQDSFNEWQPNWLAGETDSAPVDVSNIAGVPMSFFVGAVDLVCPALTASYYIGQMNLVDTTVIHAWTEGHMYFASEANDEWFMGKLIQQLEL